MERSKRTPKVSRKSQVYVGATNGDIWRMELEQTKVNRTMMWWGYGIIMSQVLMVAFIAMKLNGMIDWRWRWVLSPCYVPGLLLVGILMMFSGVYVILGLFLNVIKRKKKRRDE